MRRKTSGVLKNEFTDVLMLSILRITYYLTSLQSFKSGDYLCITRAMSLLFDKKTKNVIKYVWIGISILIIISMTLAFSGGGGIF